MKTQKEDEPKQRVVGKNVNHRVSRQQVKKYISFADGSVTVEANGNLL